MRDNKASGFLVGLVLVLFVSCIIIWAYVLTEYIRHKRTELSPPPIIKHVIWRI